MTLALSEALTAARLEATRNFLDQGQNPARLRLYGGVRPANPEDTPSSAMLSEVRLTQPCGQVEITTDGQQLVLTPETNALIINTGIVTWARLVNGDDTVALDLDCSLEGEGGDIQLAQTQLFAGGYAYLSAAILR